jgi:protocatechuate 3,4-dioxygenase beta subunit
MKGKLKFLILFITTVLSCKSQGQVDEPTDLSKVFEELKPNTSHIANIASVSEPGERLRIKGIVYEADGKTPAGRVQMYFYHTNAKGIYAKKGTESKSSFAWWHGYNRGALTTNAKGEYEINTIKPAPYPALVEPAHIHVIVKSPSQKQAYDVGAITFKGDKLATEEYWYKVEQNGHPRYGGTELRRNAQGILEGKMDYVLYAQYDRSAKNSGLLIGEDCPAFSPHHSFGHDKGSKACPMCKYGYKQGVMVWVNTDDWTDVKNLGQFLEKKISEKGLDNMRVFIIYMNPKRLPPAQVDHSLKELAKIARFKNVALLHIPSPDDSKTSGLYRINPNKDIKNTVFVYKRRRVTAKFINQTSSPESVATLIKSIDKSINEEVHSVNN